jgi:hypothetical protein
MFDEEHRTIVGPPDVAAHAEGQAARYTPPQMKAAP